MCSAALALRWMRAQSSLVKTKAERHGQSFLSFFAEFERKGLEEEGRMDRWWGRYNILNAFSPSSQDNTTIMGPMSYGKEPQKSSFQSPRAKATKVSQFCQMFSIVVNMQP